MRRHDHRPSFGQLLGGRRYVNIANMQADANENPPQRNTELMRCQFAVIIKRHKRAFSKALKKAFNELQWHVMQKA
jgi:hypothetical protein